MESLDIAPALKGVFGDRLIPVRGHEYDGMNTQNFFLAGSDETIDDAERTVRKFYIAHGLTQNHGSHSPSGLLRNLMFKSGEHSYCTAITAKLDENQSVTGVRITFVDI
ncbi:MAG: hypothetical protein AABY05_01680 [Nanoarchaeota archaeon]